MDVDDVGLFNEIRDIWEHRPCLMVSGGIEAIYPGPNTSRRNKLHAVHAYLLKDLAVVRANQAWMIDITYLRLDQGFVYLVALVG